MKTILAIGLLVAVALVAPAARADRLVLIHGYSGNAFSWEASGVTAVLESQGWPRAGLLTVTPHGISMTPGAGVNAVNRVYSVNLPSEAPVAVQTAHLARMLNYLHQLRPDEPTILVGHSVGGVVARLALVQSGGPGVRALITIASPHLGTPRAEQALEVTNDSGPSGMIREFFGGDSYQYLQFSQPLYWDIIRPYPGTLLHWLNLQPHPDLAYYAVVRSQPFLFGDHLVPGASMDLNNVPPLQGRATLLTTPTGHALTPGDGWLLVKILADLRDKSDD